MLKSVSILVAVAAIVATLSLTKQAPLPVRPEQPHFAIDRVWNEEELERLMQVVKNFKSFPTTSKDQTSPVDNIGEAVPLVDGKCSHPLMIPNKNGTYCTLPHRVDVASHYIRTGGRKSLKESVPRLISRMLSFPKFLIGEDGLDLIRDDIETLFQNPAYLNAQDSVCEGRSVQDPFQLGIILQIPGQQVPTHYDAPWFWGASRFSLPQWLLIVMEQSKLWEDKRVRQIQGVAYIHKLSSNDSAFPTGEIDKTYGGGFFYYPEGPGGRSEVFEARRGAAILLDGSIMAHGTEPWAPPGAPEPPVINKDHNTDLVYQGDDQWAVVSNDKVLQSYTTDQIRISFVWRARCFYTEELADEYKNLPEEENLSVEDVLQVFLKDLRKRGILEEDERPAPIDLAQLLLSTYVHYPAGTGTIPLNLCAAAQVVPEFVKPLFAPFCD